MKTFLMIGNHFINDQNNPHVWHELAHQLRNIGWKVITVSEKQKKFSKLLDMLWVLYSQRKDYSNAASAFQKAVEVDDQYDKAYTSLGTALIELGRYEDAVNALNQAIAIKATNGDAHFRLSQALNNLGRYQQALMAAQSALNNKRGRFAAGHIEMGKAHEGLGNITEAIASFTEAGKDRRWKSWVEWKIDKLRKLL